MSILADVLARGTRASQPAATAVPIGSTYYVTDEGITEQSDGADWLVYGSAVNPGAFNHRLTGTSATPVTTADVTAIATLYLTPYTGNKLSLYTSSTWTSYACTEKSLSLAGLIVGVCYDIFAYDNAGTVTLEALAWKKVTSGGNPAAGSSVTITLADTATLVVGMDVTVKDGSASEIARITTVTASTSIVVDTLANSYTTPDVYGYRARATALAYQDGVLCKTGSLDRRYCGTITITATTAQTEDSKANRFIWNYYNRVPRELAILPAANSWTYSTAAWAQANVAGVGKANQVVYCCGVLEDAVTAINNSLSGTSGATVRERLGGIGVNRTATNDATMTAYMATANTFAFSAGSFYMGYPAIGRTYIAPLEYGAGADTQTWYGDNGDATKYQFGLTATVMA